MKYEVTYIVKETKQNQITNTAFCGDQEAVWRLINTLGRLGYILKSVTSAEN